MKVRVRFFAGLREELGASELNLDLPEGADVAALLARLHADHPGVRLSDRRFTVAVNRAFAPPAQVLRDGDEVALIPPVSGGAAKLFEVVDGPISLDQVAGRILAPERGGITLFAGTVRGVTYDAVTHDAVTHDAVTHDAVTHDAVTHDAVTSQQTDYLEYEAYPEMAEASFAQIAAEAQARWPDISAVAVVHRVGRLEVGDVAIVIAVAAGHRANTFDACHYVIDRIKQVSPIWKKEVGPDGAMWIEGPESAL